MADEESRKRGKEDESESNESDDEVIGPLPAQPTKPKKKKVLEFEQVYIDNIPSSESYEKSYMHRDFITHIVVTKTDFLITASCDGHVKFWKKTGDGIEFVKHFRSHLGSICSIGVSIDGLLFCSVATDKSLKVFDVINFDMINMMKIGYEPGQCEWIYSPGAAIAALACSEKDSGKIHVYDGRGNNTPLHSLDIHTKPITFIKYNPVYDVAVSADEAGMVEYWSGLKGDYKFPHSIAFKFKTETDLFEFVMCKTVPTSLAFSPDGNLFATMSQDRKVRVFRFLTGKKIRVFDEDLQVFTEMQQSGRHLPDMEFGRRIAIEKDLQKTKNLSYSNIIFDESGYFLLYATLLGVKVINIHTNKCVRIIGKNENVRFLSLALYQGKPNKGKAAVTLETEAADIDNPNLSKSTTDPTIFCTANKKNRFYIFTKRDPDQSVEGDRDVFNEKPSREEIYAATESSGAQDRVAESAVVHTTMGDVHVQLFPKECPKSVENFVVHSRNGYYNGHIFHRVIKQFMIQTGDPLGDGTGGESIWGGEFEDELHHNLRHDRPYTLSMANAGPNTNGSQFFITIIPTLFMSAFVGIKAANKLNNPPYIHGYLLQKPWLDNKHTVFGRVVRGMDVVQDISNVKTNPRDDKPYEDVKILNIAVK